MSFIRAWMSKMGLSNKVDKIEVLVVGRDKSGKATVIPCVDSNTEPLEQEGYTTRQYMKKRRLVTEYDMSGVRLVRPLWVQFRLQAYAIIWVLDSADPWKVVIGTKSMDRLLSCKDLEYEPVLIYASQNDFSKPVTDEEMANLETRPFRGCPSTAFTGPGADARTQWLSDMLMNKRFGTDAQWAESERQSTAQLV